MTKKITELKDARVLKRMGAPLNTPIEDREFSRDYTEHSRRTRKSDGRGDLPDLQRPSARDC
jgi:hypothetical protein